MGQMQPFGLHKEVLFFQCQLYASPSQSISIGHNLRSFTDRPAQSVYGLATGRRSGDRIPLGARFSAPVHTSTGPNPASCRKGTESFEGVMSGLGLTLTPHPLRVPWSRKCRAIHLSPYESYGLSRASVTVEQCTLHSPIKSSP